MLASMAERKQYRGNHAANIILFYQYSMQKSKMLAQGGLSVAGRCRCLTKDSNTSIEKEGYIPYSLQA